MKRTNKASLALATAGALVLGVAPAAFAEDATFGDLPVTPGEGESYVSETTSAPLPTEVSGTEQPGETITNPPFDPTGNPYPADPTRATNISQLTTTTAPSASNTAPMKNAVCTDASGNRVKYLRHADGLNYVKDGNATTGALPGAAGAYRSYNDIRNDKDCVFVEDGNVQSPVTPGETTVDPKDAAKAAAVIAGLGVGTAVIVNGIKYFVNKDKATLVPSEDRVNQEPTAEEKAKSDELKQNNADQIASQGGTDTDANAAGNAGANAAGNAADTNRGIGATTGNNSIAKGLISLALLSVLGAAVFAFGRRRLV